MSNPVGARPIKYGFSVTDVGVSNPVGNRVVVDATNTPLFTILETEIVLVPVTLDNSTEAGVAHPGPSKDTISPLT
jgi:hypothetical protein